MRIYCAICDDDFDGNYRLDRGDDSYAATWDDCPRCGWVPSPDDIAAALANEVPDYD